MRTESGPLAGMTLGRYRLGVLLGRGGMGEVYRAEDTELRRPVAVKVLPESFTGDHDRLARFVQEARTASALNHPHLVSIYEIGEATPEGAAATVHFIAMELVQGDTLRQLLDARRPDLKRTLEYLAQAADALAAAHAANIVHRDLKPENLMIADAGYAKVLDFGLAKLRREAALTEVGADDATVTRGPGSSLPPGTSPGVVMGTVGYMSPEQAQGQAVDHRTDIFSLGCILYETATGMRPFVGTSAVDTLHKIIHLQPQPVAQLAPSCPSELQRIVRKCLAKSPDERYQSMKDVALDLRDLRRELDSGSNTAIPVAPEQPRGRARRGWMVVAGLVVLAAASGAYWLFGSRSPVRPTGALAIERMTASGLVIDAVISRDGKYLAYVESSGGQQKLLLRQTRGGRPLELVSPPGGFWGIAFSGDATEIYYALKNVREPLGTLFSIPVLGGAPRALLSGIDSNVTFSPDGTRIAFLRVEPDGSGASSLVVAGADGDNPQPLIRKHPPEFFAPGFFVGASWSPDGKRISATIRNSESADARLAVFDVTDRSEQVFPWQYAEATFTHWLPDGSGIVLVGRTPGMYSTRNGGQLWIQPYPTGEVRRLTADMLEYRNASVTADGTALLTVAFDASSRLSLMPFEGGPERRLPEDRSAGAPGLTWSSDGRSIFYLKNVRGELQLWTMQGDGSGARELIANVRPSGVAASPDGRWIVFGAERNGTGGLWRANADGSDPRMLSAVASGPNWLAMAPDGRWVYFTSLRDGSPATYRVPIEGGEPVLVARLMERAAPSPDGRLLAGIYRENPKAPISLGILRADTGTPVNILPDFPSGGGGGNLTWLPDGKTLLYTTSERVNLWTQLATGGPRKQHTNFADEWVSRFALSPDGKSLLLARGNVTRDAVMLTNFR